MVRGSGSDMRTASDSLYADLQQFGTSRGTRSRFSNAVRRAGSLETCGFKQRFWSLLGLRPKVTRARGARNSLRRRHGKKEQPAAAGKRMSRRSAKYSFGEKTNGPSGTPAPTGVRPDSAVKSAGGLELRPYKGEMPLIHKQGNPLVPPRAPRTREGGSHGPRGMDGGAAGASRVKIWPCMPQYCSIFMDAVQQNSSIFPR